MTQTLLCEIPVVYKDNNATPLPRPKRYDKDILRAAAAKLAPRVQEWARESDEMLLSITDDVYKALDCFQLDGYELAQQMEREGYEANAELVEILDDARWAASECHDAAVKEWVKLYNIKPPLGVGARVSFESYDPASKRRGTFEGSIYHIDEPQAQYYVRCAEMGHVPSSQMGAHGIILAYEDVREVE